ncbi:MAG: hypothetical protein WA118_08670 [Carboxydocellales bacterium]
MVISVKGARITAKISREDAAKELGLSLGGYAKKEDGKTKFYADELAALSTLLGVPMQNFFEAQCPKKTQNTA